MRYHVSEVRSFVKTNVACRTAIRALRTLMTGLVQHVAVS